jgi:hypothetical protein
MNARTSKCRHWITLVSALAAASLAITGCSNDEGGNVEGDTADITAGGASTLRVPIVESIEVKKSKHVKKLVAERNPELKKAGLAEFPESLTVQQGGKGHDDFLALFSRAEEASEKLKLKDAIELIAFGDGSELEGPFGKSKQSFCYTGGAKQAVALVQTVTDSVLSDQFTLKAWKFKKQAFDAEGKPFKDSDQAEFESDFPDIWKEWRGEGEAILLISSTSDGGEENNPTVLRKCK